MDEWVGKYVVEQINWMNGWGWLGVWGRDWG